ncbi:cytochrome P450 89A2-like [Alnus glutinosa]|uniref:cytochrome P450 89A2-like n=1 Tax=Alnus glutinosa TaxID=3517 RepID=UPI002D775C3A|nr:cytochrome P450 89A2-like [Alnus glutinosa]
MEVWFIILISLCAYFSIKSLFGLLSSSKKNGSKGKLPPGPRPLPFIGNLLWIPRNAVDLREVINKLSHKYGPILTLTLGSEPLIFITSYSLAQQALVRQGAIFASRPAVLPISVVLSNKRKDIGATPYGPTWRVLRRNLVSEIIHPNKMDAFYPARKRVMETLMSKITQCSKQNEVVHVNDCLHHAVFSLFILMAFGGISDEAVKEVEDIQWELLMNYADFSIFGFFPRLARLLLRSRYKRYINLLKAQDDIFFPLIKARRKLRQLKGKELEYVSYTDSLMDLQVPGEEHKLQDDDILSLCSEFINAGADTTTTMLQWTMAHIVKYPDVQAKIYAEIREVLGEGKEEVKEEDLHKLTYLKAVILEVVRIHPPNTSLVPHAVTEDVEFCGYTIPKGTTVNIVTAIIGRDPKHWENPMEFNPDRLLNGSKPAEEVTDLTAFSMLPFGAGRRMCPGNGLGRLLLEYFIANLVWRFEWKPVDGADVDLSEKEEFLVVMKTKLRAHVTKRVN